MMIRKTAPKSTRRSREDMNQVPAQKMEDFKGCYTMSSQQMEITEVAGIWTIKISTDNTITVQRFKVTILTI